MDHKKINTLAMWWFDTCVLNTNYSSFYYNKIDNYYYITTSPLHIYIYMLINKKHVNSLLFSTVDATLLTEYKLFYYVLQTFFYDYKIMLFTTYIKNLLTLSTVYTGNTWLERELKEMHNVAFLQLLDTRKLLSNYTYNTKLTYNHYSNIVNEVLV